jgi:hypothetical protein
VVIQHSLGASAGFAKPSYRRLSEAEPFPRLDFESRRARKEGRLWIREGPRELERKIKQASRIASKINDPTTIQRLTAWVDELKRRLQNRLDARRSKEKIRLRAHELWEQHGRPVGRDEEFWLRAELEIREGQRE